jgi:hypothetical protein
MRRRRDDRVRDVARQRLDVDLARLLGEHAALDDAGRLVGAEQLEHDRGVDLLVHVHAEGRSRCKILTRTG